jgi:hypothetical protein
MTGEYDVETPPLRLNIYENGRLVAQILCDSDVDAAEAAAQWDDVEHVTWELEDLGLHDQTDGALASEVDEMIADNDRSPV